MWNQLHFANCRAEFDVAYDPLVAPTRAIEAWVEQQAFFTGWCPCCAAMVPMRVDGGPHFGPHPSLRAGLVCPNELNGRARLLLTTLLRLGPAVGRCAIFEDGSPLVGALTRMTALDISTSEYLDGGLASGSTASLHGRTITHQDMTGTTYASDSLEVILHNDVLEHIPDYASAFAECLRILKPGGTMLFTAPFFVELDTSRPLARVDADGSVLHILQPPEYHGDPVRGEVLTFWHLGWDMIDALRACGFASAEVILGFDPISGILSDNHPLVRGGNNPPMVIRAVKAG